MAASAGGRGTAIHGPLRFVVVSGTCLTVAAVVTSVARHPAVLQDPATPIYVATFAVIAAAYVVVSLLATGRSAPLGACSGIVIGGLWLIELWAGNLGPPGQLTIAIYRASLLGVLVAVFAAGLLGGFRLGRMADAVSVGAWSGMLTGLLVCLIFAVTTALSLFAPLDPKTLDQFHHSGYRDLTAYLAADGLAAGMSHLWIGLGLGVLAGLAGGAIGVAARAARPQPPSPGLR